MKKNRILSMLLAGAMITGVLAACAPNQQPQTEASH